MIFKKLVKNCVGEDVQKLELYIVAWNAKWCSQYGKQDGGPSKN